MPNVIIIGSYLPLHAYLQYYHSFISYNRNSYTNTHLDAYHTELTVQIWRYVYQYLFNIPAINIRATKKWLFANDFDNISWYNEQRALNIIYKGKLTLTIVICIYVYSIK